MPTEIDGTRALRFHRGAAEVPGYDRARRHVYRDRRVRYGVQPSRLSPVMAPGDVHEPPGKQFPDEVDRLLEHV